MFCSRTSNNNEINEQAQRLILNEHKSDFDTLTLLQSNNDTCNHYRNIQTIRVEIYKTKNNLNPPIMDLMFEYVTCPFLRFCQLGNTKN